MGLSGDLLLIRSQIETDLRSAWGFSPGDPVHTSPMEIEPQAQQYATIERGTITEDYETAGTQGLSRLVITYTITGSFRRALTGTDRDAFMTEKLMNIRDALHAAHPYAGVATMTICRTFETFLGEGSEPFDRIALEFEVVMVYTRTD